MLSSKGNYVKFVMSFLLLSQKHKEVAQSAEPKQAKQVTLKSGAPVEVVGGEAGRGGESPPRQEQQVLTAPPLSIFLSRFYRGNPCK